MHFADRALLGVEYLNLDAEDVHFAGEQTSDPMMVLHAVPSLEGKQYFLLEGSNRVSLRRCYIVADPQFKDPLFGHCYNPAAHVREFELVPE